ncbi:hypothetical protein FACS1894103_0230 [Campylobacterota bacterium]|nr:hypothetical protein FACS1894103_0230 [Campylobacterota bacterium]
MTQYLVAYGGLWLLGGYTVALLLTLAMRYGWVAVFGYHLWQLAIMLSSKHEVEFLSRAAITIGLGDIALSTQPLVLGAAVWNNVVGGAIYIIAGYVIIYANKRRQQ